MGGDAGGVLRDQQLSLGAFKEVALANRRSFPPLGACEWGRGCMAQGRSEAEAATSTPSLHPQLSHPSEGTELSASGSSCLGPLLDRFSEEDMEAQGRPALTLALKVLAAQDLTRALERDGLKVKFPGFIHKYLRVVYL